MIVIGIDVSKDRLRLAARHCGRQGQDQSIKNSPLKRSILSWKQQGFTTKPWPTPCMMPVKQLIDDHIDQQCTYQPQVE